jgi:hypothetical protein
MNWDIDTEDGMEHAKQWTVSLINSMKDGGTWLVPRSLSIYTFHHSRKTVDKVAGAPEPDIERVFNAVGWTVHNQTGG